MLKPQDINQDQHLSVVDAPLLATVAKLSVIEKEIFHSLDNQSEAEILDTRKQSKIAGRFAWRVEVACDAQIVLRARQHKMRGKTNGMAEVGVAAAVRKRAKEIGCTRNLIFKNARIFELIQEAENGNTENTFLLQELDEKGYYLAALNAVDPKAALLLFASKKKELKRFRVSDAFRILSTLGLTNKAASLKAVGSIRTAPRKEVFDYLKKVKALLTDCPDTETFNRLLGDCLLDVNDQIEEMFEEDVSKALKKHWSESCNTEESLSVQTGFPIEIVSRKLATSESFIKIPNSTPQRWHKVGQPLPPELRKKD